MDRNEAKECCFEKKQANNSDDDYVDKCVFTQRRRLQESSVRCR